MNGVRSGHRWKTLETSETFAEIFWELSQNEKFGK